MFEDFKAFDLNVGEASIHGLIGGSGPPLLLLHGYPQTHIMWHKIAVKLGKNFMKNAKIIDFGSVFFMLAVHDCFAPSDAEPARQYHVTYDTALES